MILFVLIALGAAFGVFYFAVRSAQRQLPPLVLQPGEVMPKTALQRLAQRSLVLMLIPTLASAAVVLYHGADVAWENDHVRLTATGLLLAALAVFTYGQSRIALWRTRGEQTLDERDRAILASAPAGQAPAMIVTLAAWMIALTERFHDTHLVPSVFLYMMFWSCLMVSALALLAGIIVGYRRSI